MAALVLKTSPGKIRLGFDSLALRFLNNNINVGYRACGGEVYIIIDGKLVLAFHVSGSEIVEDL